MQTMRGTARCSNSPSVPWSRSLPVVATQPVLNHLTCALNDALAPFPLRVAARAGRGALLSAAREDALAACDQTR
ncbi:MULTISPECIES: hypothetical protein [Bradyrhizobium]|uniref:Uncharacterized protein n=1 Tax=Bradyrhizobium vignae TaxID=1549949 RepID=A0A2U3Q1E6_9BRAD|nr:hypothetical protein [Bradyrhizobium vignae]RXG94389.1 hypothetical protein EAV90_25490 [Bradyrhizobium vignae]SPP95235.1 protein of unknown function [Bradyrhizobium vignae]